MKTKIVGLIVLIQLVIATYLGIKIIKQKDNILGQAHINPIKKSDVTTVPTTSLKNFYEPNPNSNQTPGDRWLNGKVTYTINSDSLNERFEYDTEKRSDTFRIIALGDSFTFGEGTNTDTNYPETLEKLLNQSCEGKFEVINLGMGGYDIAYSVERYRKRGIKYSPDLILWFIKEDDFRDIRDIAISFGQEYWEKHNKNQTIETYREALEQTYKEFRKNYSDQQVLEYAKKELFSIDNYYDGPIVFTTWDFTHQIYKNMLRDFANDRKSTYLFDDIPNIYEMDYALPDGHPNTKGYRLIAQETHEILTENGIVNCREK